MLHLAAMLRRSSELAGEASIDPGAQAGSGGHPRGRVTLTPTTAYHADASPDDFGGVLVVY
nr:hypothetical protein [Mycobacterium leprae]